MRLRTFFAMVTLSMGIATNVWAEDDESFDNYDSIVSELKASSEDVPAPVQPALDWDEVAIHTGMAIATSYVNYSTPNGVRGNGLLKGFELHFGMNLFTREARAELAFRNYAPENFGSEMHVELREFEGRLVFLPVLRDRMNLRMGFGLASRTLDIDARSNGRWASFDSSGPSSSILIGFEQKVSQAVSFGPDICYRSALSSDRIDKTTWDAAIRLNATF